MGTKRAIHVVGTGTIGEPLIGLLLNTRQALEIDEITFHKNIPRLKDRAKIRGLMRRGGKLSVDRVKMSEFEKLGMQPTYDTREALEQAMVVDRLYLQRGWGISTKMSGTNTCFLRPLVSSPRGASLALARCTPAALTMRL